MKQAPDAVIFDMDGVLVNSEPLWRKAMIRGFSESGILLTEEDCIKTQGTRFKEVVKYWCGLHAVPDKEREIEKTVLRILLNLIRVEGKPMPFIPEMLDFCRSHKLKIGLATSSDKVLMNTVVDSLGIRSYFQAMVSAELLTYGKPHPEVFLMCAAELDVLPNNCLVIEDSVNGVVAAKAAQMQVIAVPDPDHSEQRQFALADYKVNTFQDALEIIRGLVP